MFVFVRNIQRAALPIKRKSPVILFQDDGQSLGTVFPILSDTSRISPIPPWCSTRLVSSLSRQLLDVLNAKYYSIFSLRVRRRVLRSMNRRANQPTDNRTNSRRAERDPSGVPAVVVDMVNDMMSRRRRRAIRQPAMCFLTDGFPAELAGTIPCQNVHAHPSNSLL